MIVYENEIILNTWRTLAVIYLCYLYSQTGRQFFNQYPSLYPFLLNLLEVATRNIRYGTTFYKTEWCGSDCKYQWLVGFPFPDDKLQCFSDTAQLHLHPGLYPVLMILGRLFQSPLEGADTSLNLAAFIPYVIKSVETCVNSEDALFF